MTRALIAAAIALTGAIVPTIAAPADHPEGRPTIEVPRLSGPPSLENFLNMRPEGEIERSMARVSGLIQQIPEDGAAASQKTDVYLGYDQQNLYAVFVAFDDDVAHLRANMTRREAFEGDDIVEIMLDTFHDERRAYAFVANPHGIQWDAIWKEGQGFDSSFDTLWHSDGRITEQGYVVHMAIPFKSLRFSSLEAQTWGLIFVRDIPRNNESVFWPRVTSRIEGRLNQAGLMRGLEQVSPGKNQQYIPYAAGRSSKVLIDEAGQEPDYERDRADIDIGLDAKFIFKDALVLDVTVNPDFSEVESDSPQVLANERFEVFFPERRPFFLENSDFFSTPINLLFTRRIVEPRVGGRFTGKQGPYSIGALLIDDRSPPELFDSTLDVSGERAHFGILRLSRDVREQSNIGFMATARELDGGYNRVAGVDARFKLNENWISEGQAVASRTRQQDGTELSGPAFNLKFDRRGRRLNMHNHYRDIGADFRTETGFVPRSDIRDLHQFTEYRFWPEGDKLINWGPNLFLGRIVDHSGTRLDRNLSPSLSFEFQRQTRCGMFYENRKERIRPEDFAALTEDADFSPSEAGAWFNTRFIDAFSLEARVSSGTTVNFVPPAGDPPEEENVTRADVGLTLRPTDRLRIANTYLLTRLSDYDDGGRIFTDQIARSQWSYQFTRRLTLRAILQYESTRVDPSRTSLEAVKNFNGDLLVTYLVNPWTALYVGYNSNFQNLEFIQDPAGNSLVRTDDDFLNDSRQLFVKFSYLFRP